MPDFALRTIEAPLTAEDHALIRNMRDRLKQVEALLVKMEECGMECSENKEIWERLTAFLEQVERKFFADGVRQ